MSTEITNKALYTVNVRVEKGEFKLSSSAGIPVRDSHLDPFGTSLDVAGHHSGVTKFAYKGLGIDLNADTGLILGISGIDDRFAQPRAYDVSLSTPIGSKDADPGAYSALVAIKSWCGDETERHDLGIEVIGNASVIGRCALKEGCEVGQGTLLNAGIGAGFIAVNGSIHAIAQLRQPENPSSPEERLRPEDAGIRLIVRHFKEKPEIAPQGLETTDESIYV